MLIFLLQATLTNIGFLVDFVIITIITSCYCFENAEVIPANCLKGVSNISGKFLHTIWNNEVLKDLKFPSELKRADVVPAFKKEDSTLVENYRPIRLLPIISKFFERIMLNQITTYMNEYLSPYLCGYRKGCNKQAALCSLIEKGKQIIDNKG